MFTYQLLHYPKKNENYGEFKAKKPGKAAEKILHFLFKNHKKENPSFVDQFAYLVFKFKNIQTNKNYCYIGQKMKLERPILRSTKNGKNIQYNYKTVVAPLDPIILLKQ